ncbi:MAG: hypothetical protein U7123_27835 [Potamolinea sp.]
MRLLFPRQVESALPTVRETENSVQRQVESDSPEVSGEIETSVQRQVESDSPEVSGEIETSFPRQVKSALPTVRETETSVQRQTESDSPEVSGEIETSFQRQTESDSPEVSGEIETSVQRQVESALPTVRETENSVQRQVESASPTVRETDTSVQRQVESDSPEVSGEIETSVQRQVELDSPEVSGKIETSVQRQVKSALPTVRETENSVQRQTESDSPDVIGESESKQLQALPTVLKNLVQSKPLGQSTSLGQASVEAKPTSSLLTNLSSSILSGKLLSIIQKMPEQAFGSYPEPNLKPPTRSIGVTNNNIQKSQITSLPQSSKTSSSQDSTNHILSSNDIPTSWSSIADLLSKNTATDNQPSVIQRKSDQENYGDNKLTFIQPQKDETSGDLVFTPEGFLRADVSANNAKPRTTINNKAKKSIIQTKKSHSTATRDTETIRQRVEAIESEAITISAKKTQKEVDNNTLEILAQEIYHQVVSRLKIEKERQGRNYSGRQPW